jgi:hypothetical protein
MARKPVLFFMTLLLVLLVVFSGCGSRKSRDTASDLATVIPAAPGTITVVVADSQLAASWEAVAGATLYKVYYSSKEDSTFAEEYAAVTVTSCVISGLANGTIYYVWVKAQNAAGTSDFSAVANGIPVAPTTKPYPPYAITLTPSATSIDVNWEAVTGATSYEVWYGTLNNVGAAHKYGEDVIDSVCIINGLSEGTTYYVWLKSKNSAGTSDFSLVHSVATAAVGTIKGLVNCSDSYSIVLIEKDKTELYSQSAYFSFSNLSPGTYHLRFDRSGYESVIKKVTVASNVIDLGTVTLEVAKPSGTTLSATSRQQKTTGNTSFNIPFDQTVEIGYGLYKKNSITVSLNGTVLFSVSSGYGSGYTTDRVSRFAQAGTCTITVDGASNATVYYQDTIGQPVITLGRYYCHTNGPVQTAINCTDNVTITAVKYAITGSMTKPADGWTTIPASTAIQFLDSGTWFLHAQCTTAMNTSAYLLAGPYIIY